MSGKEWLSKMKKGELSELADHLRLKDYTKAKKNELELMVEEHLNTNQSSLASDSVVAPFYTGSSTGSPEVAAKKVSRQRRQTIKPRDETEPATDTDIAQTITRTPSRVSALARQIPLPASPAQITEYIDANTTTLQTTASAYLPTVNSLPPAFRPHNIRAALSNPTSIHLLILVIEAWGLRSQILPLRYLTTVPAIPALGITWDTPLKIPDLFAVLTMAFWGPFGLWLATSLALPLMGAWFVNLRGEGAGYDMVSFAVTKALVAWVVYAKGGVGGESVGVVEQGVPGGVGGMLVGAGVGGLAGLWEGVLRK